jgi:hypothetical protein
MHLGRVANDMPVENEEVVAGESQNYANLYRITASLGLSAGTVPWVFVNDLI